MKCTWRCLTVWTLLLRGEWEGWLWLGFNWPGHVTRRDKWLHCFPAIDEYNPHTLAPFQIHGGKNKHTNLDTILNNLNGNTMDLCSLFILKLRKVRTGWNWAPWPFQWLYTLGVYKKTENDKKKTVMLTCGCMTSTLRRRWIQNIIPVESILIFFQTEVLKGALWLSIESSWFWCTQGLSLLTFK